MIHQAIVDRFRVALANTKTIAGLDAVLDRAWELLPSDAAVENTIVIQEMSVRRKQLSRKAAFAKPSACDEGGPGA